MIVKRLKALIEKMGGDPTGVQSKDEALDRLCACEIGGGGMSVFTAQIHWDDTNGTYVLDTPASEILAACNTGLCVLVSTAYGNRTLFWQSSNLNSERAEFIGINYDQSQITRLYVKSGRTFAETEVKSFA